MINTSRILIISPHCDDAEVAMGGTIQKFMSTNSEIAYLGLSLCDTSNPGFSLSEEVNNYWRDVSNLKLFDICNLPVRRFSEFRQDILDKLIKINLSFDPTLIFVNAPGDIHQDHQVVSTEVMRAFKNKTILGYYMPWNDYGINLNFYVSLTPKNVEEAYKRLNVFRSQAQRTYFKREAHESRSMFMGQKCGSQFAEGFHLIRCTV